MTLEVKGYPFEVLLPDGKSAVLADQVKCLDWRMRNVQFKEKSPEELVKKVLCLLGPLLQI